MTLILIVLSPKAAYCGTALLLRSPTPPGKALYLKIAPGWSTMAKTWLFLLQKGISASSTSFKTVPCCRVSFHPVFSSLSWAIVPRIIVNLLCPWEEVGSESANTAILNRYSCYYCSQKWSFWPCKHSQDGNSEFVLSRCENRIHQGSLACLHFLHFWYTTTQNDLWPPINQLI